VVAGQCAAGTRVDDAAPLVRGHDRFRVHTVPDAKPGWVAIDAEPG
jgi:hypothetical protein